MISPAAWDVAEVLSGRVGRTVDWLSKIENNRIDLDRLSVVKSLADVLDITVATFWLSRHRWSGCRKAGSGLCRHSAKP